MTINPSDYSRFIVSGHHHQSERRFRQDYPGTYAGAFTAFHINLWRGRVWGVLNATGRRVRLKTVWN